MKNINNNGQPFCQYLYIYKFISSEVMHASRYILKPNQRHRVGGGGANSRYLLHTSFTQDNTNKCILLEKPLLNPKA